MYWQQGLCYRILGISYWDREDSEKLPGYVAATLAIPGGKDENWYYVSLVSFTHEYRVRVLQCAMDDIEEIDTYDKLCVPSIPSTAPTPNLFF